MNTFQKGMVYLTMAAASLGFANQAYSQTRVGERKQSHNPLDYNGDGHVDSLLAYATLQKDGSRSVEIVSGVSQLEGKLIDKFVLPDGTCLVLANKKRKPAQIWDVYAVKFKCGDDSTDEVVGKYRNDGHGNFAKE